MTKRRAKERSFSVLQVGIHAYPTVEGGVDLMVATLSRALKEQGWRVGHLSRGEWPQRGLRQVSADGIDVATLYLQAPFSQSRRLRNVFSWLLRFPQTLLALRRLCRGLETDIVHVHTATATTFYFRVLKWIGGPPYVLTFHRGDVVEFHDRPKPSRLLIRVGVAGAAQTNAVSRWLADEATAVFHGLCEPACIYNGIEVETARVSGAGASVWPTGPYCVMVGSFDPYKGHDVAIRAWRRVADAIGSDLLVVGDGDLRPDYERLIADLGLVDRVKLLGQLPNDDTQRIIAGAAALVFPSRNEGFGYVILEAGLAGVPVISSDVPPFREIFVDGTSGLLTPVEDAEALASAALSVLRAPELGRRLGENLKRTVEERFSAATMADGYVAMYRSVLTGRNPEASEPPV